MKILDINMESITDGYGVRTVLFFSGCTHNCKGCHNPDSHDPNKGTEFDDNIKESIYNILNVVPYIDGITLSGGDPLSDYNVEDTYKFCKEFKSKYPNKTIWVYTGYTWEDIRNAPFTKENNLRNATLQVIDVLVDGPFILEKRDITLKFKGSSNQRIIDVKKSLRNKIFKKLILLQ